MKRRNRRTRTRTIGPMIVGLYCVLMLAAGIGVHNRLRSPEPGVLVIPGTATVVPSGIWI